MAKTIAQIVRARADELELSAYAIARMAMVHNEFTVSVYHLNEYLAGRKDMTTGKLDHVLRALGLELGVRQHG